MTRPSRHHLPPPVRIVGRRDGAGRGRRRGRIQASIRRKNRHDASATRAVRRPGLDPGPPDSRRGGDGLTRRVEASSARGFPVPGESRPSPPPPAPKPSLFNVVHACSSAAPPRSAGDAPCQRDIPDWRLYYLSGREERRRTSSILKTARPVRQRAQDRGRPKSENRTQRRWARLGLSGSATSDDVGIVRG